MQRDLSLERHLLKSEWDGKYKFKISGTFISSGCINTHSSSDVFRLATQGLLPVKKKRSGSGNRRTGGEYKFLFRPPGGSKVLGFIQELEIRISCDCYGLGLPVNIFRALLSDVQPFYGKGHNRYCGPVCRPIVEKS